MFTTASSAFLTMATALLSTSSSNSDFSISRTVTRDIIDKYDGFILDQFGVLHNGKNGLPGAAELVTKLAREHDKRLVILSNTSSPSSAALAKLPKMGFDPDCLVGAVTSGEEAAKYIVENFIGSSDKKNKALLITWKDNPAATQSFLKECGSELQLASSPEEADFVIAHGMQCVLGEGNDIIHDFQDTLWDAEDFSVIDQVLKKCAELNLPMINANPDFVCIIADGSSKPMPGKISERYESFGGSCTYFGKPYPEHFEACIKKLDLPKNKIAHVGDSLHHDIAGANKSVSKVIISKSIRTYDI